MDPDRNGPLPMTSVGPLQLDLNGRDSVRTENFGRTHRDNEFLDVGPSVSGFWNFGGIPSLRRLATSLRLGQTPSGRLQSSTSSGLWSDKQGDDGVQGAAGYYDGGPQFNVAGYPTRTLNSPPMARPAGTGWDGDNAAAAAGKLYPPSNAGMQQRRGFPLWCGILVVLVFAGAAAGIAFLLIGNQEDPADFKVTIELGEDPANNLERNIPLPEDPTRFFSRFTVLLNAQANFEVATAVGEVVDISANQKQAEIVLLNRSPTGVVQLQLTTLVPSVDDEDLNFFANQVLSAFTSARDVVHQINIDFVSEGGNPFRVSELVNKLTTDD